MLRKCFMEQTDSFFTIDGLLLYCSFIKWMSLPVAPLFWNFAFIFYIQRFILPHVSHKISYSRCVWFIKWQLKIGPFSHTNCCVDAFNRLKMSITELDISLHIKDWVQRSKLLFATFRKLLCRHQEVIKFKVT